MKSNLPVIKIVSDITDRSIFCLRNDLTMEESDQHKQKSILTNAEQHNLMEDL